MNSGSYRVHARAVLWAAFAAGACGPTYRPAAGAHSPTGSVPAPTEDLAPDRAAGLYRSSFGSVKIELDAERGAPYLVGVWVYDRGGQEVVGLFEGRLNGNVLEFRWEEPADDRPLTGGGYLVFYDGGAGFSGTWWTTSQDRSGAWTGEKHLGPGQKGPAQPAPVDTEQTDQPPTTI
jgi:hypothetical protein